MAEQTDQTTGSGVGKASKGLSLKLITFISGLMIAEAALVIGVIALLGPFSSSAQVAAGGLEPDVAEQTREVLVVEEKFQNLQTGRVWIWDIAVYAQVRNRNVGRLERVLDQRSAEIQQGVSQIISRAQHAQLREPEQQTLRRQIHAFLNGIVGADQNNEPVVERVLLPRCRGFPADF